MTWEIVGGVLLRYTAGSLALGLALVIFLCFGEGFERLTHWMFKREKD